MSFFMIIQWCHYMYKYVYNLNMIIYLFVIVFLFIFVSLYLYYILLYLYLYLKENYIAMNPITLSIQPSSERRNLQHLELLTQASQSISDGDLFDKQIHTNQR